MRIQGARRGAPGGDGRARGLSAGVGVCAHVWDALCACVHAHTRVWVCTRAHVLCACARCNRVQMRVWVYTCVCTCVREELCCKCFKSSGNQGGKEIEFRLQLGKVSNKRLSQIRGPQSSCLLIDFTCLMEFFKIL